MHDFDEQRADGYYNDDERRFKLAGETFTVRRSVRPERIDAWLAFVQRLARDDDEVSTSEQRAAFDETITSLLEPDSADLWREVRERDDDPITGSDLFPVAAFCAQIVSGRPLARSSDSGTGSETETAGTPSTDDSSSPAEPEPALSA